MTMIEAEMAKGGRILLPPQAVFEVRGLAVLLAYSQKLALRSFQIHRKSGTNLAR
jgi:hypothetical protein